MMISISILKHRIEAGGNIIPQESPSSQSRMSDGPVEKWTSSWASLLGSITAIGCINIFLFVGRLQPTCSACMLLYFKSFDSLSYVHYCYDHPLR